MSKSIAHVQQFITPRWITFGVVMVLLSYISPLLMQQAALMNINEKSSPNKPFTTLGEFRPYYQGEHQDETNVALHVTGTSFLVIWSLFHPELIAAGGFAVKGGEIAVVLFRHHDHGLTEFAMVFALFLGMSKYLTNTTYQAFVALFVGYGFAWAGHAFYEHNRPATFIYPTYSLICDLLMWAETISGQTIVI